MKLSFCGMLNLNHIKPNNNLKRPNLIYFPVLPIFISNGTTNGRVFQHLAGHQLGAGLLGVDPSF